MKLTGLVFAFTIGLMVVAGCNSKPKGNSNEVNSDMVTNNPATASSSKSEKGVPVIKFEKDTHDFGKLIQGEIVTYSFKFTNMGNGPLVIGNASASCGCTVPRYSEKPVQAGESGFIDVTFNSENKNGPVEKTVTIEANTIPERTVITILADIRTEK